MRRHSWEKVAVVAAAVAVEVVVEVVVAVDLIVVVDVAGQEVAAADHKAVHPGKEIGIALTQTVETTTLAGVKTAIVAKQLNQAVMAVEEAEDLIVVEVAVDSEEAEVDLTVEAAVVVVSEVAEEEWTEEDAEDSEDLQEVAVEDSIVVAIEVARWVIAGI